MFTGLVEEIGAIKVISHSTNALKMSIDAAKVLEGVQLGDSIAVNGICLTVTEFTKHNFSVDVMPETVKASTIKQLSVGSKVNLERALRADSRLGGHFVTGHVDVIGQIVAIVHEGNSIRIEIEVPEKGMRYLVEKGSITVDGTSLTVFAVSARTFTLSLIPHSSLFTTLGSKKNGELVNIEFDILAKYTEKLLMNRFCPDTESIQPKSGVTLEMLKQYGF